MSKPYVDKINPAPKWVEPPRPSTFKTTLEEQRWWGVQKDRWINGYGDGESHVCGLHYFYLMEGHLKDGSDGNIIKPKYRDCDEWIIKPLHESFWGLKNHLGLVKRREIGATSIGAGLFPSYSQRMFPSSSFGMTSCDRDRIYKAYYDKTAVFLDEMNESIRPEKKGNETKQAIYIKSTWKTNEDGVSVLRTSDLYAKETAMSDKAAKGMSGTRLRAAYLDEFPLHPRKSMLLGSIQSCVMKGPEQAGSIFWAGTVEEGITPQQISELQSLVEDSKTLNFNVIFAKAWWGLFMDENGISDEKKGTEWVLRKREELDKMDDKSYLRAFIKNFPLELEEIFELGKGGGFDEYAVERINQQVKVCVTEKFPVHSYSIEESGPTEVEARPDPQSSIIILEQPKEDVDYMIGVDPILTSDLTSGSDKKSKFAAVVMKGKDPEGLSDPENIIEFAPVALLCERPKGIEAAHSKAIRLLKHYNKYGRCKIIGELNAGGEHLVGDIIAAGLKKCLVMRQDLSKKGWVDTTKVWFYRNDKVLQWQHEAANSYFKKYAHMIRMLAVLRDAQLSITDNRDILDALMACLYGWGTPDLLQSKQVREKKYRMDIIVGYRGGTPIWETKEYVRKI